MSKRKHEQVTALSSNNNYDAILLNNKKIIILIGQNKDSEAIWVKSVYNELKSRFERKHPCYWELFKQLSNTKEFL